MDEAMLQWICHIHSQVKVSLTYSEGVYRFVHMQSMYTCINKRHPDDPIYAIPALLKDVIESLDEEDLKWNEKKVDWAGTECVLEATVNCVSKTLQLRIIDTVTEYRYPVHLIIANAFQRAAATLNCPLPIEVLPSVHNTLTKEISTGEGNFLRDRAVILLSNNESL